MFHMKDLIMYDNVRQIAFNRPYAWRKKDSTVLMVFETLKNIDFQEGNSHF